MKAVKLYEESDKMALLIGDNHNVLQSLSAFGIGMGFGDKTVCEVCEAHNVDTFTFLAIVNLTINGYHSQHDIHHLDMRTLLRYLRAAHNYYIDFMFPFLRKQFTDALDEDTRTGKLILTLYDNLLQFITHHMRYEEKTLFPYVEAILDGGDADKFDMLTFSKHHDQTGDKLHELKDIIIKYLPADAERSNLLNNALYGLCNLEEFLSLHSSVEDIIFIPAVKELEERVKDTGDSADPFLSLRSYIAPSAEKAEALSQRECDVIVGVVEGLTNKEIADKLFLSPNTVITHRRNIAKKLGIHSIAGLTIYAIANGLIKL